MQRTYVITSTKLLASSIPGTDPANSSNNSLAIPFIPPTQETVTIVTQDNYWPVVIAVTMMKAYN